MSLEGIFEDAVAVAELTFVVGEGALKAGGDVDGFNGVDDIFGFYAVCTHVLDGCCPDGAGDSGEIFGAVPSVVDAVLNEGVPFFSCGGFNEERVGSGVVRAEGDAFVCEMENGAVEMAGEYDVAAGADDE